MIFYFSYNVNLSYYENHILYIYIHLYMNKYIKFMHKILPISFSLVKNKRLFINISGYLI